MARTKKLGAAATVMSERQFVGVEPEWTGVATKSQLIAYYNWCHYRLEFKVAKDATIAFLKSKGHPTDDLATLPDYEFMTVGWTARALLKGFLVDQGVMQRFAEKIGLLRSRVGTSNIPEPKKSVIKYIDDKVEKGLELCEEFFDTILKEKEYDQAVFDSIKNRGLDPRAAVRYVGKLDNVIKEMDMATSGKHPEVAEGYADWDMDELRGVAYCMSEFKDALGVICKTEVPKETKIRKARIRKPKSAEKQVKKFKYGRSDDKYGVTSIDPRKIVGASEVWLFNTTYRKLTVLRAMDRGGLSIKGSTIYGFDEKASGMKRVRKPEIVLKEVVDGGKVSAKRAFESLKTELNPAKGRSGEDTILLRVF